MFLTEKKLASRIGELSEYRYRDRMEFKDLACLEDEVGEIGCYPPPVRDWSTIKPGDTWKGRDRYLWLAVEVMVPQTWKGRQAVCRFDFGTTGGGNNSGFESLLFVDGAPYQGVDSNHKEVFLPEAVGDSRKPFSLIFRLWSGLEGGGRPAEQTHRINRAELAWLDEEADDLYYTSLSAIQTVGILQPAQPERILLLQALDRAFLRLDWSAPGSASFYASVREARSVLKEELAGIPKQSLLTVRCVGHTHIDVAWLWRLKHTREKSARSFSTVLRLMELYPEYVFMQSQPQLYAYMKSDYPELYERIKERIREGRWEAEGGMWLEADCNLTSGESLVRQLLLGTRFLRDEFGIECRYLWLPDVFGYSWALPQILRQAGIDTFMTTKIAWNQYNRMPHDTFRWRGIDGSEVLAHFITTPVPGWELVPWFYTYNGDVTAETVSGIWDMYRDKGVTQELLLSYGYGDGGGGVNRDMLEMRRRLNDMPGLPHVTTGRADEYFARLQEQVASTTGYVHTWDGELYLEYHRGTYTSQAYNKRMNRKLELLYRDTEWISAFAGMVTGWSSYPQSELNNGWTIILRNQFHDIIPGSSIREVYEDSRAEYEEAERIGHDAWDVSVQALLRDTTVNHYTVFNSSTWESGDLVEIAGELGMEAGTWSCGSLILEAQRSADGWLVQTQGVPPLGYACLSFEPSCPAIADTETPFTFEPSGVQTPFYRIQWNEQGQLTSIFDLQHLREVLAQGARGNVMEVFEDKPLHHDAWDIDLFHLEKSVEVNELTSVRTLETGPLRAVVRFVWQYGRSVIEQDLIVYSRSRRIDFRTVADWRERQRLLKAAFTVHIRATEATYDIQYGNVKRPTHWNTSWDYARFETVGHQWADLSERGYGVSLLNDCKYGYAIKDRVIRLSLIKSSVWPDYEADQGRHEFTYSLYPHVGNWFEGGTVREAWALNNPLRFARGIQKHADSSMFRLSCEAVMIDAVKKAEDGTRIIVRMHEYAGGREEVAVISDFNIRSWQECDLLERPTGHCRTEPFSFAINPYEIKTFIVELEPHRQ